MALKLQSHMTPHLPSSLGTSAQSKMQQHLTSPTYLSQVCYLLRSSIHSYADLFLELPEGISGCINLTDLTLEYCQALIGTLELFVSIPSTSQGSYTNLFLGIPEEFLAVSISPILIWRIAEH